MNEESVMYIINYFNQYPDQPPEVLVKNVISSGYNMTDLKEALRRMGISPIVIPGYVEPEPPPPKQFPFKMIALAGAIVLIGISAGLIAFFSFGPKPKQEQKQSAGQIQQGVIPMASPSSQISVSPAKDSTNSAGGMHMVEVSGNVLVGITDDKGDSRPSGVFLEVEDDGATNSAKTIEKTKIKGLDSAKSKFYDIKLQFKDMYKAFMKIISLDSSGKPKQMIVFHELQEQPGTLASAHLITNPISDSLDLNVTDASGSAIHTLTPTYVLDAKMSQDVTPPKTTLSIIKQSGKDVLVLTANDDNSGIYKTEYSFDNGATVLLYKDPIPLDTVQTRTIDFTSTDRAGNAEELTRETF